MGKRSNGSQFSLKNMIKEPTQRLNDSVTSQPTLVIESRVDSSLHSNYYHQTVDAKFGL